MATKAKIDVEIAGNSTKLKGELESARASVREFAASVQRQLTDIQKLVTGFGAISFATAIIGQFKSLINMVKQARECIEDLDKVSQKGGAAAVKWADELAKAGGKVNGVRDTGISAAANAVKSGEAADKLAAENAASKEGWRQMALAVMRGHEALAKQQQGVIYRGQQELIDAGKAAMEQALAAYGGSVSAATNQLNSSFTWQDRLRGRRIAYSFGSGGLAGQVRADQAAAAAAPADDGVREAASSAWTRPESSKPAYSEKDYLKIWSAEIDAAEAADRKARDKERRLGEITRKNADAIAGVRVDGISAATSSGVAGVMYGSDPSTLNRMRMEQQRTAAISKISNEMTRAVAALEEG